MFSFDLCFRTENLFILFCMCWLCSFRLLWSNEMLRWSRIPKMILWLNFRKSSQWIVIFIGFVSIFIGAGSLSWMFCIMLLVLCWWDMLIYASGDVSLFLWFYLWQSGNFCISIIWRNKMCLCVLYCCYFALFRIKLARLTCYVFYAYKKLYMIFLLLFINWYRRNVFCVSFILFFLFLCQDGSVFVWMPIVVTNVVY